MYTYKKLFKKSVLVIAYACESDKGSEPAVGWNWVKIIANICTKVYLVTRVNNYDSIKKGLAAEQINNIEIICYDLPKVLTVIKKKFNLVRIYYYLWQFGALKLVNKMESRKTIEFDLVHHVTFVNDYMPSLFYRLNKKFIWGPIGSNMRFPKIFFEKKTDYFFDTIKYYFKKIGRYASIDFRKAVNNSVAIIGINNAIRNNLVNKGVQFYSIPAIGIDLKKVNINNKMSLDKRIIICAGNFIYLKNFILSIYSFYEFLKRYPDSKLWLVGDGPLRNNMKKKIKDLGIEDNVVFYGRLSREETMRKFEKAHVCLFPSMESAGFVTLEALSKGTPVVCLNKGGPSNFTPKQMQVNLDNVKSIKELSENVAEQIEHIFNNYEDFVNLGIMEVSKHTWENKKMQILDIYNDVIN